MPKQTLPQPFLASYPNLAEWVISRGWIEIGYDDLSSSLVRVLDVGGMIWESDDSEANVDEVLKAADTAIATWLEDNGFRKRRMPE